MVLFIQDKQKVKYNKTTLETTTFKNLQKKPININKTLKILAKYTKQSNTVKKMYQSYNIKVWI